VHHSLNPSFDPEHRPPFRRQYDMIPAVSVCQIRNRLLDSSSITTAAPQIRKLRMTRRLPKLPCPQRGDLSQIRSQFVDCDDRTSSTTTTIGPALCIFDMSLAGVLQYAILQFLAAGLLSAKARFLPAAKLQLVLNLAKIWCSEVFSLHISHGPHRQSPRPNHCRVSLEF
jgi:hypothetical protein